MLTWYVGITYFSRIVTTSGGFNVHFSLIPTEPPTVFFSMANLHYSVLQFAIQVKNHWHFNKLLKVQ